MKSKPKKKRSNAKPKRRSDWKLNDQLIEEKFLDLYFKTGKLPSYEDIARTMQVDVSTIKRHVAEISFEDRFKRYRLGSGKVIANLFKQAATGKNKDMIKMWLELFEDLGAKKKVEVTGADGQPLFKVYQGIDAAKV